MTALRLFPFCLLLCLAAGDLRAQAPEPATGSAKLRDYEATYLAGLQKIHTPLLNDYALKLQQLAASVPAAEQPALQAELARVQKLVASGGIVDLRSASSATQTEQTPPRLGKRLGVNGPPGTVLVLRPDTAKGPAVLGSSLTIGKAAWTIEQLAAGTYEITVLCAFVPFSGTASITATLDGQEATKDLSTSNASGMPEQFPVLRLGRFHFEADVQNKDLNLELKATELPGVQVRQVVISKPRPPGK